MLKLYQNIKSLRCKLGLSQEELAYKTGYTDRSSIAKIESGKVDLTQSKIAAFAKALGVSPAYLMGWENTENQAQAIPQTEKFVALYTPAEISHIKKYRLLSNKDKQTVDSLLDSLIAAAQTPIKVVAFGEGETTLSAHDWEIIKKAIEDQKNGS